MRAPMLRPEQPFAALEQTMPWLAANAFWTRTDLTNKMTLVHGSLLLPMFKSRSEAITSLRGVSYSRLSLLINLQMGQPRDPTTAPRLGTKRVFVTDWMRG
jgi:hypothetical protein